ncbi:hypothetical protein [Winogradskyella tangerina]|uniref:hypothetical protein n=1 Tax=Winogradskyella tangerina TaxID=2023240 RepID=UPI000DBE61B9|nr:hypothetical protein [Winogradskyella tangerina]
MKIFFTLLAVLSFSFITAQQKSFEEVSIDELTTDTQYASDSPDAVELIWWIPTEYWNVVFSQDPTASESETEQIIDLVEDYVFVMVLKGKVGMFGGITYEDESIIKKQINVTYKGEELKMIETDDLNPDTMNFISMMKPMMKNLMGAMGENMQFYVFESPDKNNKIIPIDPYGTESLKFELGEFSKEVSLPLASLLEEKICPETNKEHSGKWSYCPFHGVKLEEKPN